MPKRICECGYCFRLGEIPGRDQWLVISDEVYDQFSGHVDAEEIYKKMRIMLRCPVCGRISIFWDGFGGAALVYRLEK